MDGKVRKIENKIMVVGKIFVTRCLFLSYMYKYYIILSTK